MVGRFIDLFFWPGEERFLFDWTALTAIFFCMPDATATVGNPGLDCLDDYFLMIGFRRWGWAERPGMSKAILLASTSAISPLFPTEYFTNDLVFWLIVFVGLFHWLGYQLLPLVWFAGFLVLFLVSGDDTWVGTYKSSFETLDQSFEVVFQFERTLTSIGLPFCPLAVLRIPRYCDRQDYRLCSQFPPSIVDRKWGHWLLPHKIAACRFYYFFQLQTLPFCSQD